MNRSVQAVTVVGMMTAMLMTAWQGMLSGSVLEMGISGCAGLHSLSGSHSEQQQISLARPVTTLENRHHVGGFGDLPIVSHRAR